MTVLPLQPSRAASGAVTFAWAAYLGVSWTWCIGMFLPVLLVRDYGLWGWIVFAVPNVIGAAAMGTVLTRVRDPDRLARQHARALSAFSVVTVAFHLFFAFWIIQRLVPMGGIAALAAAGVMYVVGRSVRAGDVPAAAIVFVVSVIAAIVYLRYGFAAPLAATPRLDPAELTWMAPVSVFGFLLCPYLDATFHRAYRAAGPARGPAAFAVGFGGFFLLMILFTLAYARPLAGALAGRLDDRLPGVVLWAIGLHMLLQSGFTIAVHAREGMRSGLPLIASAALAGIIYLIGLLTSGLTGLSAGETAYRLFMAFYGLVFPAYVWICMIRPGDRQESDAAVGRSLAVLAAAVLLASPFYWLGFMQQRMVWLLPGLAIVLLARFAAEPGFSRRTNGPIEA